MRPFLYEEVADLDWHQGSLLTGDMVRLKTQMAAGY